MRLLGTQAMGIRLPIINPGDDLVSIVADHVIKVTEHDKLTANDIVAVTEAVVAKAEKNFASISDIAADVKEKFGDETIGLVFPILSRNRFYNILRGIALGAKRVYVLLSYPNDEVGNPVMDIDKMDEVNDTLCGRMSGAAEFRGIAGEFPHPFTGIDYVKLYNEAGDNVEVFFSNDPRDILSLTKNVIAPI